MTIIILIILLIITSFLAFVFLYKYIRLKKGLEQYKKIGTGRYGFYKFEKYGYPRKANVYVKEIDRYTNGYSKVEIDYIESIYSEIEVAKEAKKRFVSLIETDAIEWLEGENHLKDVRKEKLKNLKKI